MRSVITSKRSYFAFSPFRANIVNLFTEAKNFPRLAFFNSLYRLVFKMSVVYEKRNLIHKMCIVPTSQFIFSSSYLPAFPSKVCLFHLAHSM